MWVEFLQDFRGKLTREQFYEKGQQLEVDDRVGDELISKGYARLVTPALDKLVAQNDESEGGGSLPITDDVTMLETLSVVPDEETAWGEDVVEDDDEPPAAKPNKRGRR